MCFDLIKEYEGRRLQAYKCPAGVWTIGYGTTYYPEKGQVKEGDVITQEYADVLLTDYLIKNVYPVFNKIPYKLSVAQQEAVASLCYNVGVPSFLKSKLYTAICKKDVEMIFKNWDWIKGGGVVLKGLAKRRSHELYLFLKDL